jgi:hypothetical protein
MNPHADAIEALTAINRKLIEDAVKPLVQDGSFDTSEIFKALVADVAEDRERWLEIQNRYYKGQLELWSALAATGGKAAATPVATPEPSDRRFRAILPAYGALGRRDRRQRQAGTPSQKKIRFLLAADGRRHVAGQFSVEQPRGAEARR